MRKLLALCCCMALGAQAETFTAKVIMVLDGDTVMVLHDGHKQKVRLANIDAPEKDQPFGQQSRDALQALVGRKQVQVESQAVDQFGRIVGLLTVDGRNVNEEQVKRGMAWEYSHFHSDKRYLALQGEAQQAQRGLWAQAAPQPPWQWRKSSLPQAPAPHVAQPPLPRSAPAAAQDAGCGKKHRCAQMSSCAEARFYLTHCNATVLDGNRDGVPCEELCTGQK